MGTYRSLRGVHGSTLSTEKGWRFHWRNAPKGTPHYMYLLSPLLATSYQYFDERKKFGDASFGTQYATYTEKVSKMTKMLG